VSVRRDLLGGSAEDVSARLEELSRRLAGHEFAAGARLRALAVMLAGRPGLRVMVVCHDDQSLELEVTAGDEPGGDVVLIGGDPLGRTVMLTWDRWLAVGSDQDVERAADMAEGVLRACARAGAGAVPSTGDGGALRAELERRPDPGGGSAGDGPLVTAPGTEQPVPGEAGR
jgi:hypothetical protein